MEIKSVSTNKFSFLARLTSFIFLFTLSIQSLLADVATFDKSSSLSTNTGISTDSGSDQFEISGGIQSSNKENVFHRFSEFNLNNNQTVEFMTNNGTQNIFAAIANDKPSYIDGTLKMSGSSTGLFLLSPAGLIFGDNMTLDLPGNFTATTARAVGFMDDDRRKLWFDTWDHDISNPDGINTRPLNLFFGENSTNTLLNFGNLSVRTGKKISLFADNMISLGNLSAPGGFIRTSGHTDGLIKLSSPGDLLSFEVRMPLPELGAPPTTLNPLDLPKLLTSTNPDFKFSDYTDKDIKLPRISELPTPSPAPPIPRLFTEKGSWYFRGTEEGEGRDVFGNRTAVFGGKISTINGENKTDGGDILLNAGFYQVTANKWTAFYHDLSIESSGLVAIKDSALFSAGDLSVFAQDGINIEGNLFDDSRRYHTNGDFENRYNLTLHSTNGNIHTDGQLRTQGYSGNISAVAENGDLNMTKNMFTTGLYADVGIAGSVYLEGDNIYHPGTITTGLSGVVPAVGGNVTLISDNGSVTAGNINIKGKSAAGTITIQAREKKVSEESSCLESNNCQEKPPNEPIEDPSDTPTPQIIEIAGSDSDSDSDMPQNLVLIPTTYTNPDLVTGTESEITTKLTSEFEDGSATNSTTIESKNYNQISDILTQVELDSKNGAIPAIIYLRFIDLPTVSSSTNLDQTAGEPSKDLEALLVIKNRHVFRHGIKNINREQFISKIRGFSSSISKNKPLNSLHQEGKKLYQLLIAPFENVLQLQKINNLVFILDDGLRGLPITALHDGNHYLIEKYSIGLMPSVSLTDTRYTSIQDLGVLSVATERFNSEASPLKYATKEAELILGSRWKKNSDKLLNKHFTTKNIRETLKHFPHGIIHIASHANFNPGNGYSSSFIRTSDDKILFGDLRRIILPTPESEGVELLTLSACETAIGNPQKELGFSGMAYKVGAKSVIGSLWRVDDKATALFMATLYKNLADKKFRTKSRALQETQRAFIAGKSKDGSIPKIQELPFKGKYSNPFYWSGFTIVGNPW